MFTDLYELEHEVGKYFADNPEIEVQKASLEGQIQDFLARQARCKEVEAALLVQKNYLQKALNETTLNDLEVKHSEIVFDTEQIQKKTKSLEKERDLMPAKIEEAERKVEEALDEKEKVMEELDAISQDLQKSRGEWEEMKKEFEGLDSTVGDVTLFLH